ncbi:MAG: hypothetical protein FWG90_01105 [Oscillospiraceae bacterium]|nr:hypothetical protein [Oscillospiraceae bacterium]
MYKLLSVSNAQVTRYLSLENCETGKIENVFDDSDLNHQGQLDFYFMEVGKTYNCKLLLFADIAECIICSYTDKSIIIGNEKFFQVKHNNCTYFISNNDFSKISNKDSFEFCVLRKELLQVDNIANTRFFEKGFNHQLKTQSNTEKMYKVLNVTELQMSREIKLVNISSGKTEEIFVSKLNSQKEFSFMNVGGTYDCKLLLYGCPSESEHAMLCSYTNKSIILGNAEFFQVKHNDNTYYISKSIFDKVSDKDNFWLHSSRKDLIQVDNIISPGYFDKGQSNWI